MLFPWLQHLMVVSLYPAIVGAILLVFAGLVASRTAALVPGLLREFAISGRVRSADLGAVGKVHDRLGSPDLVE